MQIVASKKMTRDTHSMANILASTAFYQFAAGVSRSIATCRTVAVEVPNDHLLLVSFTFCSNTGVGVVLVILIVLQILVEMCLSGCKLINTSLINTINHAEIIYILFKKKKLLICRVMLRNSRKKFLS